MRNCWMYNGFASLIFLGIPLAIIIVLNATFFLLTIYNLQKIKRRQKDIKIRRFSKKKIPGDDDVKFFLQIAVIMGFTFFVGFFQTIFDNVIKTFVFFSYFKFIWLWVIRLNLFVLFIHKVIFYQILSHIFNLCNALLGVFIFFVFIFRPNVRKLYTNLIKSSETYKRLCVGKHVIRPVNRPRSTDSTNSIISSLSQSMFSSNSHQTHKSSIFTISQKLKQNFNTEAYIKEENTKDVFDNF